MLAYILFPNLNCTKPIKELDFVKNFLLPHRQQFFCNNLRNKFMSKEKQSVS